MNSKPLTDTQKLVEVEALIESFRWARNDPAVPEHRIWLALKALADDLRGRRAERIGETQIKLQSLINEASIAKTGNGYEIHHLRRIAEFTIGHWPTIRQALQRFGEARRN